LYIPVASGTFSFPISRIALDSEAIAVNIKVNYKGLEVIVDSLDDLDKLAERLAKSGQNGHLAGSARSKQAERPNTISAFVATLKADPKTALRALLKAGGQLTDAELCKAVGVGDNLSLAGRILSPMARLANSAGLHGPIIAKVVKFDLKTKERSLDYIVPTEIRAEVEKGLKM
jgi:hypothetical protein